jgi:hypothetical protein
MNTPSNIVLEWPMANKLTYSPISLSMTEKDHAEQEEDVIVASEHVLGAQIHKGQKVHASDLGNKPCHPGRCHEHGPGRA